MPSENIVARFVVEGMDAFRSALGTAKDSTGEASKGADTAGKGFAGMAKNVATAAAGAAVAKKGFDFLKGAAGNAGQLAKDTAALTRQTGMDAQSASAWVSMAKMRGVELGKLQTSLTAFSKQTVAGQQGNKASAAAFEQVGVSAADLNGKLKGDFQGTLSAVADGFNNLPAGADKSALAVKLFGKQGLALLPLLNQGSQGLQEQMDIMQKHGLTMDEAGIKKGLELAKTQRELKTTTEGLKQSIGQALIPVLATVATTILPVVQGFAQLLQKSPALTTVVIALGVGLAGLLIAAKIAAALTALGVALGTAAAIVSVVGIVLLLGAAFVIAYKKIGWFRNAVDAVFGAIKTAVSAVVNFVISNWKIFAAVLLGPLAPLLLLVLNFGKVKDAVVGAFNAAVGAIGSFISTLAGAVGSAIAAAGALVSGVANAVAALASRLFTAAVSAVASLASGIAGAAGQAVGAAGQLVSAVVNAIGQLGGQLLSKGRDAANQLLNGLRSAVGGAANIGREIINAVVNAIKTAPGALMDAITSIVPGPLRGAISSIFGATGLVVAAQTGMTAGGGKTVVVGERGPEVLSVPSGSRVTPLPPPTLAASQLGAGGDRPIIAQVFLERRMIAEALASHTADQQAAR